MEYTYNANGAMTQDLNKGISSVQYNLLNLPQQVDILSPVGEARNTYVYAADGTKLRVVKQYNTNYNTSPVIGSAVNVSAMDVTKTTDYVGNKIFENGVLDRILVDGGFIDCTNGSYQFYITDHLGNNRMVIRQDGIIMERNDYYPFGMRMAHYADGNASKYKFGNKELDVMHGLNLYDFDARSQDPALRVFTTMDPLAEKYYSISPYAYCANNPMNAVDLRGDSLTYTSQTDGVAQKAVDAHNTELSGYYKFSINEDGVVSMTAEEGADMNQMTTEQKAYSAIMDKVVNGTDGMTKINVVENSTDILIGNADLKTIDIGDINKLPSGPLSPVSAESAHLHEVYEQYQLQVGTLSAPNSTNAKAKAHIRATGCESALFGTS